jgi:ABC-2 type transport system ATP-binding protein
MTESVKRLFYYLYLTIIIYKIKRGGIFMVAIKTIDLSKQYKDVTAVNNLNLEINEGELFALLGVNGAGKTTVIKMLSCLTKPTKGDAVICGYSIQEDAKNVKRLLGVSPQETAVAPNLSVEENLELICGIHGFNKDRTKEKIKELAGRFFLDSVMKKKAGKLSGGWQRRVSIAMALISEPKVLFLDEPTLGLDVIARRELWNTIKKLKNDMTIVLTTHYMEEAQELSDRIGIMMDGKLLFVGNKEELYSLTNKTNVEESFIQIVYRGEFDV